MFTYQYLDIDYQIYETILHEIVSYIDHLNPKPITVQHIDIKQTVLKCPTLFRYTQSLRCGIINDIVIIHSGRTHEKIVPHIDYSNLDGSLVDRSYLAINFPIKNCHNSLTKFYEPVGELSKPIRHVENGVHYLVHPKQEWTEIDSYTLDRPVLLNTNVHHAVINNTDDVRISLSVRFRNDPWHLI